MIGEKRQGVFYKVEEPKWDLLPMLHFPKMQPGRGEGQSL